MRRIDLNCDMGEGYPNDAELMKYISSTNVACGFHAGDATTMSDTVQLALESSVAIGAHPGYRDLENFGRLEMSLRPKEVFDIVTDQIAALADICNANGAALHHVKPHGALYNQAGRDKELAASIAEAVLSVDDKLILYGLSGSLIISEAQSIGLRTASEVFADRTYRADGSLTPRNQPDALIVDSGRALAQVLQMVEKQQVTISDGCETIPIRAETICIHGDGDHAVDFAQAIAEALARAGVRVSSPV